jgi:chromosome segregation ATPase
MSELSNRLSQLRQWLDDVVEADQLVDNIGDLLGQRNALRAQLAELDVEIMRRRRAVEQEVAALDVDLATRQRAFAEEIARMEGQTANTKAEQLNVLRAQLTELDGELMGKRRAVEQEVAALDVDLAARQSAFAEEIARMEEQTAAAKAEQARAEHDLRDVRMRLDHTQTVYDDLRRKFA